MDFWVFRPAVDTWKHCEPLYKAYYYYQSIVSQKARENLLEMLCVCVCQCVMNGQCQTGVVGYAWIMLDS